MKEIKEPTKPRKPASVKKPRSTISIFKQKGSISSANPISLSDFIDRIKIRYCKKMNIEIQSVNLSDIFLEYFGGYWGAVEEKPNLEFDKQNKHYKTYLADRPKKWSEYEDRVKKYEIDLGIYNAWILKQQEDELANQLKEIEVELEIVRKEKAKLLATIDGKNEQNDL